MSPRYADMPVSGKPRRFLSNLKAHACFERLLIFLEIEGFLPETRNDVECLCRQHEELCRLGPFQQTRRNNVPQSFPLRVKWWALL